MMHFRFPFILCILLIGFILPIGLSAQKNAKEEVELDQTLLDQLNALAKLDSLNWQSGTVTMGDNLATIQVPEGFHFLNPTDARFILVDIWGNPPQAAEDVLGMIFPKDLGPISDSAIGFVFKFDPMGYVNDEDATKSDYNSILTDLQKETEESNKFRKEAGYGTLKLIGWASAPYYDQQQKTLHWAKEIAFDDNPEHTLNYDARILGRKGVLSVNGVGSMMHLEMAKTMMPQLLSQTQFTSGNRYADFDSKIDDVAAYTVGGLVAGKVLAKVGFFAVILKFIKPIIIGLLAFGGGIWRFITGRRKEEDEEQAYQEPEQPNSDKA